MKFIPEESYEQHIARERREHPREYEIMDEILRKIESRKRFFTALKEGLFAFFITIGAIIFIKLFLSPPT